MKVWLVGGGTAGHVVPLLALAAALTDETVTLITDRQAASTLPADTEMPVLTIAAGKFRRYHGRSWLRRLLDIKTLLLNIRDVFSFMAGLGRSLWLVWRHKPDVVFINGGAIGVPIAFACRLKRIPFLVHESDVVPGLANRLIAKRADKLLFGFDPGDDIRQEFAVPTEVTGIQLRSIFYDLPDIKTARERMGLPIDKPVVLVTGGSLGGRTLVDIVLQQLEALTDAAHVVHVTGRAHSVTAQKRRLTLPKRQQERYRILPYVNDDMALLMRAADIVVSRAGATTLAELAQTGTAAIIVPNPRLAGDHQTRNAARFESSGGAIVLEEAALQSDSGILTDSIRSLIDQPGKRRSLVNGIRTLAVPDATDRIVAHIRSMKG